MPEDIIKLTDPELGYVMAVIDTVGRKGLNAGYLVGYHQNIIDWLLQKSLLVIGNRNICEREPEKRVYLGPKALDSIKESFDYRMNILKAINNG